MEEHQLVIELFHKLRVMPIATDHAHAEEASAKKRVLTHIQVCKERVPTRLVRIVDQNLRGQRLSARGRPRNKNIRSTRASVLRSRAQFIDVLMDVGEY